MKHTHLIYVLSDAPEEVTIPLETALASGSKHQFKLIAPKTVYKTDFAEADFILIDYQFFQKNAEMFKHSSGFINKLAIYATLTDHEEWNDILKSTKIQHFFGTSGVQLANQYLHYLNAILNKTFWTADTFLTPPFSAHSKTEVKTSDKLDHQIEKIIEKHDLSNCFEGFKPILINILNETLTNALYNAPVDAHGNFIHQKKNRKSLVQAAENLAPLVEITEDSEKMVISVKDFYGTLKREVVEHYLTSGKVAEKEGGAGVGMYMIMKHAHQLIINVEPSKLTEFMIVIHKFKRFYHYQGLEKSFHFFQRGTK